MFDRRSFGPPGGLAGRYRPEADHRPRYATGPRRKFKQPWIWRFLVYHLMAAFGIVVAFIVWLLMMVVRF